MSIKNLFKNQRGFTLVELIVGIAVVGILGALALPSLSRFIVGLRVDSEVLEMHRLILITRNTAISTGNNTIICPVVDNACVNQWGNEISVFEDVDGSGTFSAGDIIIKVKAAINGSDQLQFSGGSLLTFLPSGILNGNAAIQTFSYCANVYAEASKGVIVSIQGRPYITQDTNTDGLYVDRAGNTITCS